MKYTRMPIEIESPEQIGYDTIECNLAESSVTDAVYKDLGIDLNDLVLCYGHHIGKPELRELIAKENKTLHADDVLLTAGAAAGLFIVATSLLAEKDHLIVIRPNYATNIETPKAIGCELSFANLKFEEGFKLNIPAIEKLIKPNTRYISITYPHNPTGTIISAKEMDELIKLVERKNIFLLIDETYRELIRVEKLPLAASLSENVISVSSISKAYGLPGIRMGWLITRNKKLQELFLAAKEQIFVCNSVVDEEIAFQYYQKKEKHFAPIKKRIDGNFKLLEDWMSKQEYLEWVKPQGGVVCFPRIKKDAGVDVEKFYSALNTKYKTFVGPGHWFDMDKNYMRIGFGWPSAEELQKGLENIARSLSEARNK